MHPAGRADDGVRCRKAMSRRWLKKDFPEPWADREERAMKDRLSGLLALVPAEDRARALGKPPDYSKRVYDKASMRIRKDYEHRQGEKLLDWGPNPLIKEPTSSVPARPYGLGFGAWPA